MTVLILCWEQWVFQHATVGVEILSARLVMTNYRCIAVMLMRSLWLFWNLKRLLSCDMSQSTLSNRYRQYFNNNTPLIVSYIWLFVPYRLKRRSKLYLKCAHLPTYWLLVLRIENMNSPLKPVGCHCRSDRMEQSPGSCHHNVTEAVFRRYCENVYVCTAHYSTGTMNTSGDSCRLMPIYKFTLTSTLHYFVSFHAGVSLQFECYTASQQRFVLLSCASLLWALILFSAGRKQWTIEATDKSNQNSIFKMHGVMPKW